MEPFLVDAVIVPELMDQGDRYLVEQLFLVLAHPGQRAAEQHDPVRLAVPKAYVAVASGHEPDAATAESILRHAREISAVTIAVVVVTVVLISAVRYGHRVSALVYSDDREVFLLKLIGAALLVAGVASALQVSAAVGAFLLGIAISGSIAHEATRLLEPLRDLFAALFFVVFGLNTDPRAIPGGRRGGRGPRN